MALITTNVSGLTLLQRLARGQDIITKSTNNPEVPGNTAVLAAFASAQTVLDAAEAAVIAHRTEGEQLIAARDAALAVWQATLNGLAGFTESATGGVPEKILMTGFGVRGQPSPPVPVGQVQNVRVLFNGHPGYSEVRWKRESSADAYVLECCQDPITPQGWKNVGTVTEAKFSGNGAIPGQACWYWVAGVNRLGLGPWSVPALRPVM